MVRVLRAIIIGLTACLAVGCTNTLPPTQCDECEYLKRLYDSCRDESLSDTESERVGRKMDSLDVVYTERGYWGVEGYLGEVCGCWNNE